MVRFATLGGGHSKPETFTAAGTRDLVRDFGYSGSQSRFALLALPAAAIHMARRSHRGGFDPLSSCYVYAVTCMVTADGAHCCVLTDLCGERGERTVLWCTPVSSEIRVAVPVGHSAASAHD